MVPGGVPAAWTVIAVPWEAHIRYYAPRFEELLVQGQVGTPNVGLGPVAGAVCLGKAPHPLWAAHSRAEGKLSPP